MIQPFLDSSSNIDVQSTYYNLSNNVTATPNTCKLIIKIIRRYNSAEGASLGTKLEGSTSATTV